MEPSVFSFIDYSEEIQQALKLHSPIVALESTIITHGMEYPMNKTTALEVESIIRSNGAIPATIAIIQGRIKVGLTPSQLEYVAFNKKMFQKCSRRDLAATLVKEANGSTTVAATMFLAELSGLKIFVTGGIGGVHRGAESSFDISADLTELGRTPIAVISAGAKSILDIGKTLEYLETQGVAVIGFKTEIFPEFFVSDSGFKVSKRLEDEVECAKVIDMTFNKLKMKTGVLITIPVPKEQEADGLKVKIAIDLALEEAKKGFINGAELTPFLLKRINEITEGDSSKSNIALIKNNAKLGALIAKAYYSL